MRLCVLCETRSYSGQQRPLRPAYPFSNLVEDIAHEWLEEKLEVGNLTSLRAVDDSRVTTDLDDWVRAALLKKLRSAGPSHAFQLGRGARELSSSQVKAELIK